jgi:hypothetical protein
VGVFAAGGVGVFVEGVGVRAGHNGSVRGGTRRGRVGGGSTFAGRLVGFAASGVPALADEPERDGKSFVSGFRNDAVTRRGDNGLVGGLVVAGGRGAGAARRVESGPVGGLPVVAAAAGGLEGAVAATAGGGVVVRRAPSRPVIGLLEVADNVAWAAPAGACDRLLCSLLKISCARVFV